MALDRTRQHQGSSSSLLDFRWTTSIDMGRNHSKARRKQNKVAAAMIDAKPMEESFPILSEEKVAGMQVGKINDFAVSGSNSHLTTFTTVYHDGHGPEDKKRNALTALPRVESPEATMDVIPAEDVSTRLLTDDAPSLEGSNSSLQLLETIEYPVGDRQEEEEWARATPRPAGRDFSAVTDGYISFSESESDITFSKLDVGSDSPDPAFLGERSAPPAKFITAVDAIDARIQPPWRSTSHDKGFVGDDGEEGTGSDEWNIYEDSCDEREQRGVLPARSGAQSAASKDSIIGGFEVGTPGPAASGGNSENGCRVLPESQEKVIMDRLGRRVNINVPTRGWGDDTEGAEEHDDIDYDDDEEGMEGDDGEVYDWTTMDSNDGELGSVRNQQETTTNLSGENTLSTSTSRAKAEANPLGSKLGLTSTAEAQHVRVISGPQQGSPLWSQGRGRGLGRGLARGRAGKPVVPRKDERPLYAPLMQGHMQHLRARPRLPSGVGRVAAGFGSWGSNTTITVVGAGESSAVGATRPSLTTESTHSLAPGSVHVGAAPIAATPAIASSAVPSLTMRRCFNTARAPGEGGTVPGGNTPLATSRAQVGFVDGGPSRVAARPTAMVALPERGGEETEIASALTSGSPRSQQLAVKDTANVTRKKVLLPQQEQLEHPSPVRGSWIKNRHIVNNFILLESLGTGSYAEVRLAKEKTSNKLYAVKIMNKDFLKKRQVGKEGTFMDGIQREIAIMKKINHPNVLRLYEVMDDPKVNKLYLVLEFCKKGDLMNILNGDARALTCDPMNDTDVWYIMRQIVQGLNFLHQQNIVHGDIKPQNLLVSADNVAKIADFGISKMVQGSTQRLHEQVGTPTFMSPEICSGGEYSGQLADVWALGATMYMIRCGRPPFVANQVLALYEKIQNDPLEFPPVVNMSSGLKRLLLSMMQKEPDKRINLDQVVSDPWLRLGDYGLARAGIAPPSPIGHTPHGAVLPAAAHVGSAVAPTAAAAAAAVGTCTIPRCDGDSPRDSSGQRPTEAVSALRSGRKGYENNAAACGASENEVCQNAIDQGTSTIGCAAPVAGAVASVGGNGILSRAVVGNVPRGSPATQRSMSPSALADPKQVAAAAATTTTTGQPLCSIGHEGITTNPGIRGRGHLTEKEELWKYRSFVKRMMEGNGSEEKFRAEVLVSGDASPERSPSLAEDDSEEEEDDGINEFSSDELDMLFEQDCASTPETSPRSQASAEAEKEGHDMSTFSGKDSGRGGGDGGTSREGRRADSHPKRLSSVESFDVVMDTLAAQPRPSTKGHDDSGQEYPLRLAPQSFPLRDLSLRNVTVTSSPTGACGARNGRLGLIAAASQRQGRRPNQEDRITMAPSLALALAGKVARPHLYQHYGFFGVFDGHNGRMCSEALCRGLHVAVAKQAVFHQSPEKALIEAFNSFDKELCSLQEQEGDTSGSTGLVVLFDGLSRGLLVANVGDSRCVASRAGVAIRLTNDHRLSRPDERQRVTARGCFVANNRINRVLAISRSFGDVQHKEGESPGLIAIPEISSENCCTSGLDFVILATDGLWDVVDDQEAVNFLRMRLSENGNLSAAAKQLTKLALGEGSVDNVSVVVVWFQDGSGGSSEAEALPSTPPSLPRRETASLTGNSPSRPQSSLPQD